MFNIQRPMWALFLCLLSCLLITACGGGGGSINQPASSYKSAPAGTGNPYYPMTPGTSIAYYVCTITGVARLDTFAITIPSDQDTCAPGQANYVGLYSTAFSLQSCQTNFPGMQMYAMTWYTGANPPANFFDLKVAAIAVHWTWTDVSGRTVSGMGEAMGDYGTISAPEPAITDNPVVGQHIHDVSYYTDSCDSTVRTGSNEWEFNTLSVSDATVETAIREYTYSTVFNTVMQRSIGMTRQRYLTIDVSKNYVQQGVTYSPGTGKTYVAVNFPTSE